LLAVFLDLLGFGMLVADIQLRAQSMMPEGWPTGVIIGALLASTFVTQLIASPKWGRLSDERSRKPIVVLCTIFSAVAMLVYGFAGSLWVLLLSRILSGLGGANVAIAQAYISDRYTGEQRTAALGRVGAAISTGLIVGPPLGGFLAAAGESLPRGVPGQLYIGLVAGLCSLLGAVAMWLVLPNIPPTEKREPGKRRAIDLTLIRDYPKLKPLIVIVSVAWFSLATLEGTFARLINHLFGYNQLQFGFIFGYESLLGVFVQAFLIAWIIRKWNSRQILRTGYVMQGLGLALNPAAAVIASVLHPLATLFIASTIYAIGSGIASPTINSLCSREVPDERQGELFGILQGSRSFGFVAGPLLGGALFDLHPTIPYILAGVVCVAAAMLVPKPSFEEKAEGSESE
jgi:MFS family permease